MKRGPVLVTVLASAFVVACHGHGGDKQHGRSGGGSDTQGDPPIADDTPSEHADLPSKPPHGCGSPFYAVHYGDALKTLRDAESYKATARKYYVRELSDNRNEYLDAGISPKFREEWFGSHRTAEKDRHCMAGIFDALGNAAKRTLPKYRPRGYTHHDDDGLIKDVAKERIPDAQILEVGVSSPTWEIEKLRNGIPRVRYKYGMAWVKTASADDGYCRIVYVNIQQDYSGGGTFGESRGHYIKTEPAGCK
ncbi:MAG TPA: hypothetical protein VGH63_03320 [Polyangia bacterium]